MLKDGGVDGQLGTLLLIETSTCCTLERRCGALKLLGEPGVVVGVVEREGTLCRDSIWGYLRCLLDHLLNDIVWRGGLDAWNGLGP